MKLSRVRFTVGRLMLEVAFVAVMLAPAGCISRHPAAVNQKAIAWVAVVGWAGMLPLIRWAYRDFRSPFG